ncbi:MAG: hypothetical protein EKK48_25150 [Candidatus Melainabacteria bacterium]|nr:MAG: hypothetical protein EKK48_25150 [Candidatus Melainabacteria bacterium]
MKRLEIRAVSPCLPTDIVQEINGRHESLVRQIDIDFVETGFYARTKFRTLRLTQKLLDVTEPELTIQDESADDVLHVISVIPVSDFEKDELWIGFEYVKERAVQALAQVAENFDLNARSLSIRSFQIRGAVQASIIGRSLPEEPVSTKPYHSNLPDLIPVKRFDIECSGTKYIGKYAHGNQFWAQVVATFRNPIAAQLGADAVNDWRSRKCWYAILHKFDAQGNHLGTDYRFTGTTADDEAVAFEEAIRHMNRSISALGRVKFGDIAIRLFKIEIDGSVVNFAPGRPPATRTGGHREHT